mmetsp:Transcript_119450/g.332046  ORF Transcript_119450/g.332046 Transcript_119450/m.332046 type:complete len:84 (+) Transcript_119450:484-735(+)
MPTAIGKNIANGTIIAALKISRHCMKYGSRRPMTLQSMTMLTRIATLAAGLIFPKVTSRLEYKQYKVMGIVTTKFTTTAAAKP